MSNEWLKDLKKSYLFSTLGADELRVIAEIAELRVYEPGDTVFSQGEKPGGGIHCPLRHAED